MAYTAAVQGSGQRSEIQAGRVPDPYYLRFVCTSPQLARVPLADPRLTSRLTEGARSCYWVSLRSRSVRPRMIYPLEYITCLTRGRYFGSNIQ